MKDPTLHVLSLSSAPWSIGFDRNRDPVVVDAGGCIVVQATTTREDIEAIVAVTREYPATISRVADIEVSRVAACQRAERAESELAAARALFEQGRASLDASIHDVTTKATLLAGQVTEMMAACEVMRARLEVLEQLADAVTVWKRTRHTPNLLAAIERLGVCKNG